MAAVFFHGGFVMSLSLQGRLSRSRERLVKRLILDRLASGIEVQALADACYLSRSHFSRAFKRSTGVAPQLWIQQQRIVRARKLLRGSDLSLSQIALECGFCDQAHFCRSFARAVGDTPLGWRAGS
ncbi:helix-turn-helix domain-containing protein [Pseudomonas putida]|nr:AraC family transcriptional regulator [Pseudomonas putida]